MSNNDKSLRWYSQESWPFCDSQTAGFAIKVVTVHYYRIKGCGNIGIEK